MHKGTDGRDHENVPENCPMCIEQSIKPAVFQFADLDQMMMLMIYGATNLIDKSWTVEKQAKRIAEFNAQFMNLRVFHETEHMTKHQLLCPFCSALKLSEHLHRGG